ncbi:hypothetical protein RJT34_17236 [Clitoria ternatea]|uniref:Late embryogenesis abundant protein LEA-2 subgroup domain-containing protein n=1 Tax=Clitoria ternatea TaxID=43366 RepID=A0AAN9PEM1_CLITE
MTDRVHPSAKSTTANSTNPPAFPATKSQLSGANRPTYRPQPYRHRRSNRGLCRTLCCWFILLLIILLILVGAAATAVYFLFHPQRPSFSVNSLKLSYLKLTPSSTLNSKFDLTLSTTNPNKKISFLYDPTTVSILSGDADIAGGTVPAFEHRERNTTVMEALVRGSDETVESDVAMALKKRRSGLTLKVVLETKVVAKMGVLKTPRVGIKVLCDGVSVTIPAGVKPATASTSDTECDVDVRFKVWKWTLG